MNKVYAAAMARRRVLVKKVKISNDNEIPDATNPNDITTETFIEVGTVNDTVTGISMNSTKTTETEQATSDIHTGNGMAKTATPLVDAKQLPESTTVVPQVTTSSGRKVVEITTLVPTTDKTTVAAESQVGVETTNTAESKNNINELPIGTNQDSGVHTTVKDTNTKDNIASPTDTTVGNNPDVSVVIQVTSENQRIFDKSNQTEIMEQPPDNTNGTENDIDYVDELDPMGVDTNTAEAVLTGSLSRKLNPIDRIPRNRKLPNNFPSQVDFMVKVVGRNVERIRRTCGNDITGRDRPCCNSAVRCFDDVKTVLDELDNAPKGSFSLASACRKVGAELRRDRLCVQQSLALCGGSDRSLIQRRFDTRVDNLYNQYNRYCSPTTVETTPAPTTTTVIPEVQTTTTLPPETPRPIGPPTDRGPTFNGSTEGSGGHGIGHTHDINSPGSSAIIAGVVTGGIILGLVLIIAVVLWCRNRRDRHTSGSSTDSAGIFFQKRPNTSANNNRNNNNKRNVDRQLSDVYAEIDEAMVNPGYKPPLPGSLTLPGYIHPVSDEDSGSSYSPAPTSGRATSVPAITTRGQLSYGPILAANARKISDVVTPYHSTTITTDEDLNRMKQNEIDISDMKRSPRYLPRDFNRASVEQTTDLDEESFLDDYELPISANASLRYASLENDPEPPPSTLAPAVPSAGSTPTTPAKHKKMAVKVLPSNPFPQISASANSTVPVITATTATSSQQASCPVPMPRKRSDMNSDSSKQDINEQAKTTSSTDSRMSPSLSTNDRVSEIKENGKALGSRDSCMSESSVKSSHHYFVLEPQENDKKDDLDYENSISAPKLV